MPYPKKCHATKELLEELYHGQGLSQEQIAKMFGIHQSSLWKIFKRMGIQSRPASGPSGEKHWLWKGGKEARPYRYMLEIGLLAKEKCLKCGTTDKLLIHHIDLDHYNNSLSNLQVLCLHCHLSLHKTLNHKGIKSNGPIGWRRATPDHKLIDRHGGGIKGGSGGSPGNIGNLKDVPLVGRKEE